MTGKRSGPQSKTRKQQALFLVLASIIATVIASPGDAYAGCERANVQAEIERKYSGRVKFASSQYNSAQAIPIAADIYFFGGTISSEWVKSQLKQMGMDGARFLAENRFNPTSDEVIGDLMTFKCYERPYLPFSKEKVYGPNIFVPYIALRSKRNGLAQSGKWVRIQNRNWGRCLNLQNATTNGVGVNSWECVPHADQEWSIIDAGDGYVKIRNRGWGRCLNLQNATSNGVGVNSWECVPHADQEWSLSPLQ